MGSGSWGLRSTGPGRSPTSVPEVIYTIPPSSPLHYVTYVYVYGATPQTVTVGYTPGYYGTVLAPTGVVVYGTGYVYPPVYLGCFLVSAAGHLRVWPGFFWGSVTGFAFGRRRARSGAERGATGEAMAATTTSTSTTTTPTTTGAPTRSGPMPSGTTTGNRQQRQQAQRDYDRRTGQLTPQQRNNLQNRASTRPNDTFAGKDGNAYRRGSDGSWQQHGSGGWNKAGFGGGARIGGRPRPAAAGPELRQLG